MKSSVIILSWNGMDYLEDCLSSVLTQDYPDFEVIVVDNASTDGSADFVAERYPQVRLIRNRQNLGFAAGNNVGLRAATGDVLVLLNQDTVVQTGWLAALVAACLTDPDIGIVGSKALYPDGSIQHAGGYVSERGEGIHYGYRQADEGQFDQMQDVDYVSGTALGITRAAFESIDELDEGFVPVYFEDVDWCYRARGAGFRVVYAPEAVLVHKEASSTTELVYDRVYVFERNRLRFVLKHWPTDQLRDRFLPAERHWLESWGGGSEWLIAAVHHAYLYNLLHLADAIAGRREVLEASLDEVDVLADVLLKLRAVVPLKPTGISVGHPQEIAPALFPETLEKERENALNELHESWSIREHEFRSNVPIIGPLIAAFRRQWNRVSTEWYVRPMIQQQVAFNAKVATMSDRLNQGVRMQQARLDQQAHDQRQLAKVLAEYIGENGREIAELAREINRMNALLEKTTES
jgi:GT2 family glycosyltransferase